MSAHSPGNASRPCGPGLTSARYSRSSPQSQSSTAESRSRRRYQPRWPCCPISFVTAGRLAYAQLYFASVHGLFYDRWQTNPTLRPTFPQIVIRLRQLTAGTVPAGPASDDDVLASSVRFLPAMPTVTEDAVCEKKLLDWLASEKCGIGKDWAARQTMMTYLMMSY